MYCCLAQRIGARCGSILLVMLLYRASIYSFSSTALAQPHCITSVWWPRHLRWAAAAARARSPTLHYHPPPCLQRGTSGLSRRPTFRRPARGHPHRLARRRCPRSKLLPWMSRSSARLKPRKALSSRRNGSFLPHRIHSVASPCLSVATWLMTAHVRAHRKLAAYCSSALCRMARGKDRGTTRNSGSTTVHAWPR